MKKLIVVIFLVTPFFAKGIDVCLNSVFTYTGGTGPSCGGGISYSWSVSGATVLSQSGDNITVRWSSLGAGYVRRNFTANCSWGPVSGTVTDITVNVVSTAPTPPAPVVQSYSCNAAVLSFDGTPPANVTWYWQSESTGTATSNSASQITVYEAKTYYLRAKNDCGWSNAVSVSTVTGWQSNPSPPALTQDPACSEYGGDWITFRSSNSTDQWYTASTGGTPVNTGNTFQVSKTDTRIFYVEAVSAHGCVSTRSAITRIIRSCTEACKNQAVTYTDNTTYPFPITSSSFTIVGGTQTGSTGTSVTVNWSGAGVGSVIRNITYYSNGQYYNTTKEMANVYITPFPDIPPQPTVSYHCNSAVLSHAGTPPSDVSWYWQELPDGTSMDRGHSQLRISEPGTYYLRAKNVCGWSDAVSIETLENWEACEVQPKIAIIGTTREGFDNDPPIDILDADNTDVNIQYYDGLGRVKQSVSIKNSYSRKDLIQPVAYDPSGREAKKYLPFTAQNNGVLIPNSEIIGANGYYIGVAQTFYAVGSNNKIADDLRPFTETIFEASPLNRPSRAYGAGQAWSQTGGNKFVEHQYTINIHGTIGAQEKIIAWEIDGNGLPVRKNVVANAVESGGYYSTSQLYIKGTSDEHGREVREYADKDGRVILKKVQAVDNPTLGDRDHWAQTYYIYDDFGNLRFVLQPELSRTIHQNDAYNPTASDLDRLAFRYKYDERKRMTEKKVPGAAVIYMVYDDRDRLVLTQDGNQRNGTNKNWSFTKYDALNRPVLTGIYTADVVLDQAGMQDRVNDYYEQLTTNQGAWFESYTGNVAGNVHGYDNKSFPMLTDPRLYLTVTYYDHYDFTSLWGQGYAYVNDGLSQRVNDVTYIQPSGKFPGVIGQVTGTKVKVLDGGITGGQTWLKSVNYYDDKYRLIQAILDNYKGGMDRISNLVDFTGKVLKTKTTHTESDIRWTNVVGAAAYGNKLVRNVSGSDWGDSGAASVQALAAGEDGWVEHIVSDENVDRMFGLSEQDVNAHYNTIQYAFYLRGSDKTLQVYEGTLKSSISGGHSPGDVLRIQRTGTTVKYFRNGVEVYSSLTPSLGSLLVDVALRQNGVSLSNVRSSFSSGAQTLTKRFSYDHAGRLTNVYHTSGEPVVWTSLVGTSAIGDQLTKTGALGAWNAGAFSQQSIPAGTDGWVEFRVNATSPRMMLGFSDVNTNTNYNTIDFALYPSINGALGVFENGESRGQVSTYTPNDVFRVERKGSTVYYKKNNTVIYTSTLSSTSALYIDCSIYNPGAAFSQVTMGTGNGGEIEIARHEYNELGQLVDKKLHSESGSPFKQSVDYRYNIRGWLASVNDAALTPDGSDPKDFFGMELGYNTDIGVGNASYYNGNISAIKWSNNLGLGEVKEKAYAYSYDPLNRLTGAAFKEKGSTWNPATNSGFSESNYSYDLNGNILGLTRYDQRGSVSPMDNLVYSYGTSATYSNRLLRVTDQGDDFKGFVEGVNSGDDYTYDPNGNMISDLNKGISTGAVITYNFLNLPEVVTKGGNTVRYIYDATGRKLSQVTTFSRIQKQTDYVGEFTYENDALQFIDHEDGRMVMATEKTIYTHDGGTTSGLTASNATLATVTQNGGQTYVRATSDGTTVRTGIFPIGGAFPVSPGGRYRVRVKGYRTGANAVHILMQTNAGDLNWPGAALPGTTSATEAWIEQTVTIPEGVTQLEAGVVWNTVTAGQQFFLNEFEIIKLGTNDLPEYQYHLKDHLGNVRLTFTTRQEEDAYMATLEESHAGEERAAFPNYDEITISSVSTYNSTDEPAATRSVVLNAAQNKQVGLAKSLKVVPGDIINMEVYAKYFVPGSPSEAAGTQIAASIASAFGLSPSSAGLEQAAYQSISSMFNAGWIVGPGEWEDDDAPKAYLNYILFDEDFIPYDMGWDQIDIGAEATQANPDAPHDQLTLQAVASKPGYAYIYISNEDDEIIEVYFDDLNIRHVHSPVIQADDYYPFGLTFNSYSRENSALQNYLYNGKEIQDELNLDWYDYGTRMYLSDIGRWGVIDPKAEKYSDFSTYNYALNNPMLFVDPNGEDVFLFYYLSNNHHNEEEQNDADAMFWAAALTRATDMLKNGEIKDGDKYIIKGVSNMSDLKSAIEGDIAANKDEFGKTKEVGLWSHSGLDGPFRHNADGTLDQLSVSDWGKIDFNWVDGAKMGVYGCRSGKDPDENEKRRNDGKDQQSFAQNLSSLPNMANVEVWGQSQKSWPSPYSDARVSTSNINSGNHKIPTYMVGSIQNAIVGFNTRVVGQPTYAHPMAIFKNGQFVGYRHQPGEKLK